MCKYCEYPFGKDIEVKESPLDEENRVTEAQIVHPKDDTPGMVLYRYGLARGYFDINYCPMCGRKL